MASYNSSILERFAERRLAQASMLEVLYAVFGLGLWFAALWILEKVGLQVADQAEILLVALGGIAGYLAGREKAFKLRFEAQLVLWRVQVERNTRPVADPKPGV